MNRKTYKSKPQHLVVDPKTGEIIKIIHSADTEIGNNQIAQNLKVFGDIVLDGNINLTDGNTFIAGGPNITVTTSSNGQIVISAVAASGASASASYVTIASEGGLTSERVLTAGTGIKINDGGAGSAVTLNINDGIVATVSGTNFSGVVKATGGISGSIQQTVGGLSYLVGGSNVTITSASNGQITIAAAAASGAPSTAQYLTLALDGTLSAERVLVPSTGLFYTDAGANNNYTIGVNDRIFAALTGSNFTGATSYSAPATFSGGLSGSLTHLQDGTSYIIAGSNITIVTGSGGQITISSTGGTAVGSGDPNPQYLTLALTSSLTNERVFTPGIGLKATDGGANSTYTLFVNDNVIATISGSTFTGPVIGATNGGFTGSLTKTTSGTPFITVPFGNIISILTGSNGQIVLSGSSADSTKAPINAAYVTIGNDATLTGERALSVGTGIILTDAGANSNVTLSINNGVIATLSGSTFTGPIVAAANGGITGSITQTTAGTPFITSPSGNAISISTGSNGQIILSASISGGSGAPTTSPYVTIGNDGSLSAERALTAGTGLILTDGGANSTVTLGINNAVVATVSGTTFTGPIVGALNGGFTGSLTITAAGTPFITSPSGNIITILTSSNGQIVLSGSGANIGAPKGAQYLTLALDPELTSERVLTAGNGLTLSDTGANGTATLAINNGIVATVSGTTFTGPIVAAANGGITGSITVITTGVPYITAPANNAITVSTGSNGQIILSASISGGSGASVGAQYLQLASDATNTSERVFTPSTGLKAVDAGANSTYTLSINDGVVATLSGSTFTGAILAASAGGITGSITQTRSGTPFITSPSGNAITVSTGSNGQIILSASISGGSGAPTTSPYVTIGNDGSLSAERALTAGTGIILTDGGANSTVTLGINNGIVATVSGTTFTGAVLGAAAGGFTGSLTQTRAGTPFLTVPANNAISISTGSNGQVLLSASIGAPTTAPYLTLAANSTLTSERVLTAGTGIQFVDAGAGGALTVHANNSITSLTAALSYDSTGFGSLSLLHSGTTVTTYDSVFRTHNIKGRVSTTNNTITTVCAFLSGANGRSYGVDAFLMAQHTTTIECARWKLSAHYYRTGGSMVLLASDTALSSSNATLLSGTLTISGGNILVRGTGTSTGTFNWAAELRVQELG